MNLAYPQIWHSLSDLIRDGDGIPAIEFIDCVHLGIEGSTVTIGAVQHILSTVYDGRALCIGFVEGDDIRLAPPPRKKVKWDKGDRAICVIRRL